MYICVCLVCVFLVCCMFVFVKLFCVYVIVCCLVCGVWLAAKMDCWFCLKDIRLSADVAWLWFRLLISLYCSDLLSMLVLFYFVCVVVIFPFHSVCLVWVPFFLFMFCCFIVGVFVCTCLCAVLCAFSDWL